MLIRTLGLDLASYNGTTGICRIDWSSSASRVEFPAISTHDDDALLAEIGNADWTGIDAPFGFPVAFVSGIELLRKHGRWPDVESCSLSDHWREIIRRATDLEVHRRLSELLDEQGVGEEPRFRRERAWPLSSVVEQITSTTVRCAHLLTRAADQQGTGMAIDRIGFESRIVEAYPIAALHLWDLVRDPDHPAPMKSYKNRAEGRPARKTIVANIVSRCPYLEISVADQARLHGSDDAIDALVCALIARLASDRASTRPPAGLLDYAEQEGWIHLPPPAGLGRALEALDRGQ